MGVVKRKSLKLVYVVFPANFSLSKPVSELLKSRLIVCANVLKGMESHYFWQGKVEKSKETIVIFKVLAKKERRFMTELARIHPYEVPFVGVLGLESVNSSYLSYAIQQQT